MSRALCLMLAVTGILGCQRKPPPPLDVEVNAVVSMKQDLDHGEHIYDMKNKTVRNICRRRTDIKECAEVLARLPPLMPRP